MKDDRRQTEPPLSTRECADFIGCSTEYIREAIRAGELQAEQITMPGKHRGMWRIHPDDFRAFLVKVNFRRIPA